MLHIQAYPLVNGEILTGSQSFSQYGRCIKESKNKEKKQTIAILTSSNKVNKKEMIY